MTTPRIRLLKEDIIAKIAAGEVVERPVNVTKELIENALDAGATAISIEIADGGISLIRVTDNGTGILREDIPQAFLRHATSKIEEEDDLLSLHTLGFRGEALSSIAAVSKTEMITKTSDALTGVHVTNYPLFSNGEETEGLYIEEVGAPNGTTVIIRDLFYNVPVRRKFLKQAATEAAYITEMIEHLALSHPSVSFHYIVNKKDRLHTTGSGDLKDVLYRIYGREVLKNLLPLSHEEENLKIEGYIGRPSLNRGNRDNEVLFINGRVISSPEICRAVEEGYGTNLMQHRFPFAVLQIMLPQKDVDVNIHPSKKEVRFTNPSVVLEGVTKAVQIALKNTELLHRETVLSAKEEVSVQKEDERKRTVDLLISSHYEPFENMAAEPPVSYREEPESFSEEEETIPDFTQEEMVLTEEHAASFRFLGQLFSTYWLIEWEDRFLIVDQHAAHEKANYEKLIRRLQENEKTAAPGQQVLPAILLNLSAKEEAAFHETKDAFLKIGFELEEMGSGSYALRAVPVALYGNTPKELFLDTLHEWMEDTKTSTPKDILHRIAEMSCKASVKGGQKMHEEEAKSLIATLLTLEDPFHCPHGRPTMIELTKYEIERKFKRIV